MKSQEAITVFLSAKYNQEVEVIGVTSVYGGSISEAYQIKTNVGSFFVKINDSSRYPGMFNAEAKGLSLLKQAGGLKVPEVVGVINGSAQIIVLEFIERGIESVNSWRDFGLGLSKVHQNTSGYFGLDHNNYIGSLKQINTKKNSWVDFFIETRLVHQVKICRNKNMIDSSLVCKFDKLYKILPDIIPEEKPSLLHGDLWNGNYLLGTNGKVTIFDPALYYGHREMDIGMSLLFGGFDDKFYQAYNENVPLEPGWENRLGIFQLYPLLVHLNLFGSSYLETIENIVKKY